MKIKIERYCNTDKNKWDEFLDSSKNSHFFFKRDYLEYHKNRFKDFSLLIYKDDTLISLLPANIDNHTLYSHQGLTFGGLIVNTKIKLETMLEIFTSLKEFLSSYHVEKLIYKPSPTIYHKYPAQEDLYALSLNNAKLIKRELISTIDLTKPIKYSNGRKWSIKKSKKLSLSVRQSDEIESFWYLLCDVLKSNHNSEPTHTLKDLQYLFDKFPNNIKLYFSHDKDTLLAGALLFENEQLSHLQYVANSKKGRKMGALDLIIDTLILKSKEENKKYFSFGTSSAKNDIGINLGLIDQKERFGAFGVVQDRYELKLL